jgi:LytS/YehU family sensor histidine kinase
MVLKDSILNEETIETTTLQNARADFDKKEAVIQATHQVELKEQKKVKYALAGGAGLLTIGGVISFAFYKRKRDAITKQKEAELNAEISDTEMKALRAQMNPHFIFNSLNSIGDYISKNKITIANGYLTKFAKLMRMILENSEKKEVSLAEDLKALELYMKLESLRMKNKFVFEITVDDAIDKENTMVPPLLLQPFVENSIWHGIAGKEGTGKILVTIKKEKQMISCIVEDDGIGRNRAAVMAGSHAGSTHKSLGMKITKARIAVMNKVKKSEAFIQLSDLAKGTRVEVKLPLELSL